MKASENETVAEVLAEFGKNIELMRKCNCVGVSLWNCLKFKLRIEAAHGREISALNEVIDANLRVHKAAERADADAKLELNGEIVRRGIVIAELRDCLEQACGDKLGTYTMKGTEVQRWLKALEGVKDEGK